MWLSQDPAVSLAVGVGLGIALLLIFKLFKLRGGQDQEEDRKKDKTDSRRSPAMPTPQQALHLIQNRRTIGAKVSEAKAYS